MNGTDTTKKPPTFIIAEAGVNHNGSPELAKKLIDAAKNSGVDAIKFQTFRAKDMVSTFAEKAEYQKRASGTEESQFKMIRKLELSLENFSDLKEYCDKKDILFLSTPFDNKSVDFLENLVPLYKIGSGEITNLPFLEYIAKKGKPIILSTGMSILGEVEEAINSILPLLGIHLSLSSPQFPPLTLLHCVSNYPADYNEVNLKAMITLKESFKLPIGYSDHTLGIEIPVAAVALGARIIEKHFTLDRNMSGPDHTASLEPCELKEMVTAIRNVEKSLGNGIKKPTPREFEVMKVARRSLVVTRDIKTGEILKESDIAIKRPSTGISPNFKQTIVGMRLKQSIKRDKPINWRNLK